MTGLVVASSPVFKKEADESCCLLQLAANEEYYAVVLVEQATDEMAIGLGISIRRYVVHDGLWIDCHREDIVPMPVDAHGLADGPVGEQWQHSSSNMWRRFQGPPLNLRGRCTGIVDAGLRYELDGRVQLRCEGPLCIGTEYVVYNLCKDDKVSENSFTACPLFTSIVQVARPALHPQQWSIHDRTVWREQTRTVRRLLEGLLSSYYFKDVEGYDELGLRICRSLQGGPSHPATEFVKHCQGARCRYCAAPVLPSNLFATKDHASGTSVSLLGLLSVCRVTGRPIVRAGELELGLLLASETQVQHPWRFEHLILCLDATFYRDRDLALLILSQPPIYVAPIVDKGPREGEATPPSPVMDLVMLKAVSPIPSILNKTDGMVVAVEGYKFGKLHVQEGRLEMMLQSAVHLSISAAVVTRKSLAPGVVIAQGLYASPDACRVLHYTADSEAALTAKEIKVTHVDRHAIRVTCSPAAVAYLQASKDLLTSRASTSACPTLTAALVMDKEYVAAALLGLPQPARSKLPHHIQGEKYLVVSLQCAFMRHRLCLPPGFPYPLGLVVGAKLALHHCRRARDPQGNPLLLPTSRTVISFIGMQQQWQAGGEPDLYAFEYPVKFIHELGDSDYATINGRFLRLSTLQAQAKCPLCSSLLRAARCPSHGIISQSDCRLEFRGVFDFADGLEETKVVISDTSILTRLRLLDVGRLREVALVSEVAVEYHPGALERLSSLTPLLEPFGSLLFLAQDYHLTVLALAAPCPARLQVLAIKPVDYFGQCRRLLSLNEEALLTPSKETCKQRRGEANPG